MSQSSLRVKKDFEKDWNPHIVRQEVECHDCRGKGKGENLTRESRDSLRLRFTPKFLKLGAQTEMILFIRLWYLTILPWGFLLFPS